MKPREWGLLSRLCRELLQACGNPLFSEVYARFNRYSHLPFFFTCDDSPLRAQMDWHGDFFTALENRNIQEKYNWLTASYLRTADAVRMSLNLLEAEYRGVVLPPAEPFQWGGLYGYDPIYIQIAQDLIAKINTGVYPLEQYLPHEAELAKAYGVSLTTVRKALVELRRLGYCRTLNVKGSIAQRCSIETVCRGIPPESGTRCGISTDCNSWPCWPALPHGWPLRVSPRRRKRPWRPSSSAPTPSR